MPEDIAEDSNNLRSISTLRLNIVTVGLWLALFVSAIEVTIVSTALIKISDDFNALSKSQWLIVSYLMTFNAFLLIVAKLSDVFGQKMMLVISNILFLGFSMGCGAANTMNQLIIFRALQGVGGSGLFSLVFVVILKLVSLDQIGLYSGLISTVFVMANLLGPILGGVITDQSTWRWIFYMNGPICALSMTIILFAMPKVQKSSSSGALKRFDIVGGILSVAWSIPLLFAIQEGGSSYSWSSSVIIGTLVAGIVGMFIFLAWETWLGKTGKQDPILPMRLLADPVVSLVFASVLLMGFAFYPAILLLPQRFQAVNGASAARAGVELLPLTLVSPIFSLIAGIAMEKRKPPAQHVLFIAACFIALGTGLLSNVSTNRAALYGYEVLLGVGLGMLIPASYTVLKLYVRDADLAPATGMTNFARAMGGSISVSICSALLHDALDNNLKGSLSPSEIDGLKHTLGGTLSTLPSTKASEVRKVFGASYNKQFRVMLAFAAANVVVTGCLVVAVARREKSLKNAPERDHDEGSDADSKEEEKSQGEPEEKKTSPPKVNEL